MSKPWRIGLVMEGDSNWMGGVEYIKNIVFAVQSLPNEVKKTVEICLICDESLPLELYESILPYLKDVFYTKQDSSLTQRILWRLSRLIFNLKESSPRISKFLSDNPGHDINFLYPCFTTSKKMRNSISAAWISDFQHKYLPKLFVASDIQSRDKEFDSISKYAKTVVVSSQSAKNDYHQFFPDSKADVEVLSFATFPIPEWFSCSPEETIKTYSIPERFFLVSNQFWQHKNHETVFKAVSILKEQGVLVNLVCTGKLYDSRDLSYGERISTMIESLNISKQVFLLGLIPKEHQIQLIRSSLSIVQPSLFEGWSTIVEDARCFGKRIALSNISVHLEQNPPKAFFFEKNSAEQLATILKTWWKDIEIGFDEKEENIARQSNHEKIKSVGYEFLRISKAGN
jgi:glycosyltransferase involved in cell wall biosynthesis